MIKVARMERAPRELVRRLEDGGFERGINVLQKPFTPHGLATKVREVLES